MIDFGYLMLRKKDIPTTTGKLIPIYNIVSSSSYLQFKYNELVGYKKSGEYLKNNIY
jgi:hypothetical protein